MRQVRQRVTLLQATLFRDLLVAAGKRNGLERDERDLLRIVERKPDDRSDLVVVDAVDQRGHKNNVNAGFVQVVDRTQLDVKEVADLAVRVGVVADTVELQINETKTGFGCFAAKFFALRELDTVGRRLHRVVSDLACIADRSRKYGDRVGSPPENWTDICRRGLIWIALSRIS